MPGDRERDRRVQQRTEIVSVMRVLPEVVGVDQQEPADSLLKAGVELIAVSGSKRRGGSSEHVGGETAPSGSARKQEILVERSFHRPGVGDPQDRSGLFDVVGDSQAGLRAGFRDQTVVMVEAKTEGEYEVACGDGIVNVGGELIDIGRRVKGEKIPAAA